MHGRFILAILLVCAALCGCTQHGNVPNNPDLTVREESAFLLDSQEVRKEIHASKSQAARWDRAFDQWRLANQRSFDHFERSRTHEAQSPFAHALLAHASPKQQARLSELACQALGWHAFGKPDVAQALKLTTQQVKLIDANLRGYRRHLEGIAEEMALDMNVFVEKKADQELFGAMFDSNAEQAGSQAETYRAKSISLLTASQFSLWKKVRGLDSEAVDQSRPLGELIEAYELACTKQLPREQRDALVRDGSLMQLR